ncbi:MAG: matrixin family metalloprotease [Ignavibacteriales bacterium]|nr:matrixin family metalloprotease [Ignavibacteriales bacterium]
MKKFLPEFIKQAKLAFQPWSRATYGLIRFEETLNINNADIILNWSDNIVFGRDFEVGHNNLKVVSNKIEKAEITIIVYPMIDHGCDNLKRIERVRRTALHEIGHAIGLNHSNNSKDVMFHRGINNKNLSSNDIKRINELYNSVNPDIIT